MAPSFFFFSTLFPLFMVIVVLVLYLLLVCVQNLNSCMSVYTRGYACPICNRSMVDMSRAWRMLDNEVARTPMPAEYADFNVMVGY